MKSIRKRLTYANVISTLGVFFLLAGGSALAAKQLGKKTVGAKQLKSNAVTTAKIKKAAVTRAKIAANAIDSTKVADGSVTGSKIADGAVTGGKIAAGTTVFTQRVARLSTNATASLGGAAVYPVGTYTQNAGEDNQMMAAIDIRFAAACAPPRTAAAYLLLDAANPAVPEAKDVVGLTVAEDKSAGEVTRRFDFGGLPGTPSSLSRSAPVNATPHTFTILLTGGACNGGTGIAVIGALVDVIGTK